MQRQHRSYISVGHPRRSQQDIAIMPLSILPHWNPLLDCDSNTAEAAGPGRDVLGGSSGDMHI